MTDRRPRFAAHRLTGRCVLALIVIVAVLSISRAANATPAQVITQCTESAAERSPSPV